GERRIEMELRDVLVADNGELGARAKLCDPLAERGKLAGADRAVIAARAERNRHDDRIARPQRRGHDGCSPFRVSPSATTISSTILSCGTSRDCTVTSANA